ncbi:MAG TPA: C40 family peptidase [Flavitalea sp.]|nr:C40 family peptidase [Flavitalea sp.]
MNHVVCCVPVSAVRASASHKSEMVTQHIFGEILEILEEQNEWSRVKNVSDDYEGWCLKAHVIPIQYPQREKPQFTGDWVNVIRLDGNLMYLPFGCDLSVFLSDTKNFLPQFDFRGNYLTIDTGAQVTDSVISFSEMFLNTAYLWGGKSVFGIDCSGLTQSVYRLAGLSLPRDAWQQAEKGNPITTLQQSKRGDLAFFDNKENRIVHVGILVDDHTIIHASGKVRIDLINEEGILHSETKKYTHHLCGIRRYF